MSDQHVEQRARDTADLEKFGYKQELNRGLGTFSSFAVAFSYISPSTGIFTLFFLGMSALGARLWWTWPTVALFQFVVALNFAEVTSHFPLAGSVFQWTKYLAGRGYAWITGWFYLFAGILTVASVCATLPIALIPALNNMFLPCRKLREVPCVDDDPVLPRRDVHVAVRDLRIRHGVHARGGDAEPSC